MATEKGLLVSLSCAPPRPSSQLSPSSRVRNIPTFGFLIVVASLVVRLVLRPCLSSSCGASCSLLLVLLPSLGFHFLFRPLRHHHTSHCVVPPLNREHALYSIENLAAKLASFVGRFSNFAITQPLRQGCSHTSEPKHLGFEAKWLWKKVLSVSLLCPNATKQKVQLLQSPIILTNFSLILLFILCLLRILTSLLVGSLVHLLQLVLFFERCFRCPPPDTCVREKSRLYQSQRPATRKTERSGQCVVSHRSLKLASEPPVCVTWV